MNEEFFRNVPSEIIINILSRLPVRNVLLSKCVCKPWLDLIGTPEFAKSHLSRSVPGLLVYRRETSLDLFNIFDFEEASDELEHHEELHYKRIADFYRESLFSPSQTETIVSIAGSANGLLLFCDNDNEVPPESLYMRNLITCESIQLPSLEETIQNPEFVTYGFGVTKTSGEYKVVRTQYGRRYDPQHCNHRIPVSECWIYTLGTVTWRSIPTIDTFDYYGRNSGVFLNGNIHWLVEDLKDSILIYCLNLETESFSSFTTPRDPERGHFMGLTVVLGDCLCLCDNTSNDDTWDKEIVIWVMKEYGVETSWSKELVISQGDFAGGSFYPLKVFRGGDILMWWSWDSYCEMIYYSNKTKTNMKFDKVQLKSCYNAALLHTLSFVSLKDFVLENVTSFRVYSHSEH